MRVELVRAEALAQLVEAILRRMLDYCPSTADPMYPAGPVTVTQENVVAFSRDFARALAARLAVPPAVASAPPNPDGECAECLAGIESGDSHNEGCSQRAATPA